MIRRAPRPDSHYTILRNDVLRDSRLSYRARGLLAAILSRPDDWRVTRDQLASEGREGRDAVGSALNELEECGYLRRVRVQARSGVWSTQLDVHDTPFSWESAENAAFLTGFQEPMTGKPTTEKPTSENQSLLERTIRSNDTKKPSCSSQSDEAFDRFWEQYPRKTAKADALKAWKQVTKHTDPQVILAGLEKYGFSSDGRFVPYPASWLRGLRWTDEPEFGSVSAVEALRKEML